MRAAGAGGAAGEGAAADMVLGMDDGTQAASNAAAARALAPAERAAARACIDGLKCMATMLQQHEGAVGALLGEMVGGDGGEDGEGDGDGETLRALAALAGGLHKVLPGGDAAVKKLLVANLAREAQARAEAARRGGLDLFPCRTQVLSDPHLLGNILSSFVRLPGQPAAPPPPPDGPPQDGLRRTLNNLSLVSHLWNQVARREDFWHPICQQLLPVCADGGTQILKTLRVQGGYFGLIRDFGRCFMESRLYMDDEDWFTDLIMNVEIYDNRDNFLFFSACGPVALTEETPQDGEDDASRERAEFRLSMAGKDRQEIVGPPFSAHSRDPDRRFESMADFFRGCHEDSCQAALTIRITLKDKRTGRMGVLWNTGDGLPMHVDQFYEEHGSEEDGIPQGALTVATREWAKLHCLSPSFMTHDFDMNAPEEEEEQANGNDKKPKLCSSLWGSVGFMVNPVANQAEDVPEGDKLWVFAGGDKENYERFVSFTHILFSAARIEEVGRFVRSLLV